MIKIDRCRPHCKARTVCLRQDLFPRKGRPRKLYTQPFLIRNALVELSYHSLHYSKFDYNAVLNNVIFRQDLFPKKGRPRKLYLIRNAIYRIFFQSTHQVAMKNLVKCYKDFFGCLNALKTHGENPLFMYVTRKIPFLCYKRMLRT